MEKKHSPLPWKIDTRNTLDCELLVGKDSANPFISFKAHIQDADGKSIADTHGWTLGEDGGWPRPSNAIEVNANAALILQSVNSYAAMREALEASRKAWENLAENWDHEEQTYEHYPFKYGGTCRVCEAERNVKAIDAALALANGKEGEK